LFDRFFATLPGRATLKGTRLLAELNLRRHDARSTVAALARDIDRHGAARRRALRARIGVLLDALDAPRPGAGGTRGLLTTLIEALQPLDLPKAWLMLGVLGGRLPGADDVVTAVRLAQTDGPVAALRPAIWSGPAVRVLDSGPFPPVEVISGAVLVDVDHTAKVNFATGIQRVTRESIRRWAGAHDVVFVGWHDDRPALRRLTPPEARRACWGGPAVDDPDPGPILIPVGCRYLLPELATEPSRTGALLSLAQHSSNRMAVIGYDMCPITVPETCGPAMPAAFARNLAAVRYADAVATISEAAAVEYRGWAAMLPQIGIPGPRVTACVLPNEGADSTPATLAAGADRLLVGGLPMVLVVGSHEPRKNHLAVLHSAELLWREGRSFSLTFIGGNSWSSEEFLDTLQALQLRGRPVESISAAGDDLLFAGYRLARFTVFPSFNEGFGLPVVESIACGTPVITSDFGSMREITADGGALLVDPRSDHAVAGAMRTLLTDDVELERLAKQARQRPTRTWDSYADEVWRILNPESESTP
jgi:glycosyltransferase involved in cell wall biosynthesis